MQYYKEYPEFDPSEIIEGTRIYLRNHTDYLEPNRTKSLIDFDDFQRHVPSFMSFFKENFNLTPTFALPVVVAGPGTAIHTDLQSELHPIRINLPIIDCEYSETRFFELKPGCGTTKIDTTEKHNGYYHINESDCNLVGKFILKHPTALAVTKPHQVFMLEPREIRVSLTIFFKEDLTHLLAE